MRVLLDSHALLWAVDNPAQLSAAARTALQDPANELLISAGSLWEIAIKVGLRKLILTLPYRDWITRALTDLALTILPITVDYADAQIALPWHHRDPFDRLVIAQALTDGIEVVSADSTFDSYGVRRIW
jgi:PIN domain nuclease of toxin-antitoxin system